MLSAASCVDWAASLTGVHNAGELIGLAEKRGQLGGCKVFLPYLSGERVPQNDPNARGLLMGLDHDSDAHGGGAVGDITVIDANRDDPQNGWDTDQFRMAHLEITHSMVEILGGGGFNFDPKVRRQTIDAADLFYGHVGSLCVLARGLIAAASILEEDELDCFIDVRYAGWNETLGKWIMDGASLEAISDKFVSDGTDPPLRSGRQEWPENILNRHL